MPAPAVMSDLDGLLKNVYANFRIHVQNLLTPLRAQLENAREGGVQNVRWGGNGIYWDVVVGRPAGGSFSPGGYFPTDTLASEKQASSGVARAYVTRQIDGLAFLGTKSKEAAYDTIARKTMEEIRSAGELLMQQALHGAGNGVFGVVSSSADTTHCVVTSPYGVSGAGQGGLLLSVGDTIVVRDATGTTRRGASQITAISNSGDNATLTLGTAVTGLTSTDLICKGGATGADDSYSSTLGANVFNGLIGITNRGGSYTTLHGLSASTYPILDPVRVTPADASSPSESDIYDLIKLVAAKSGKDAMLRPNEFLLMTTPGVAKKLMEGMIGQRRFDAAQTVKVLKGGYKAVEVCGLPLIEDGYIPSGTIYLLHKPSLAWVDAMDWAAVQFEDAGAWRPIQGRHAFETSYAFIGNLVALARNAHGSISGYTDTTRYTHVA